MMMNRRAFSAALVTGAAASLISTGGMAANSTPAKASNVVLVHGLFSDGSKRCIGSAIVYSSGFAELGTKEATAAQEAVALLARSQDVRVIGPNCIGIAKSLTFMPSFEDLPLKPEPVGIVTQSGALEYA
jgi:acyl-CoA synthetase (NDP forming)